MPLMQPWRTPSSTSQKKTPYHQSEDYEVGLPPAVKPPDVTGRPAGISIFNPPTNTTQDNGSGFGGPATGAGSYSSFQSIFNSPLLDPRDRTRTPAIETDDRGMNAMIQGKLAGIMNGQTRFSPEIMEKIRAGLLETATDRQKVAADAIRENSTMMGPQRSGQTVKELGDTNRAMESELSRGFRDLEIQKATTDFEDKMTALNAAQTWLDRLRADTHARNSYNLEQDKLDANLALAYAKLREDRLSLEYDYHKTILGREPIEGRDFIYVIGEDGQRKRVFNTALNYGGQYLFGG